MIHLGDCIEVLKSLPENSVDAIVTDPPYGFAFMGKKWDYDLPSVEIWKECLRVLKPGGHMLAFGGPRTYHRMACGVEDAGFDIRDQLQWLFGSGFPKSLDISKAIDKAAGAERTTVISEYKTGEGAAFKHSGAGKEQMHEAAAKTIQITAPSTPEAKQWEGWGTALKPANEPILLARKPLSEKTVAGNVLKWGTGGLNIDAGRIEASDQAKFAKNWDREKITDIRGARYNAASGHVENKVDAPQGRFPANLLLDEEAAEMLDAQTGNLGKSSGGQSGCTDSLYKFGSANKNITKGCGFGDTGGASRFFYVAKSSKREKNAGLEGMPITQTTGGGGLTNCGDKFGSIKAPAQNSHPTVKPIKLMEYLVKLITPPGGIVLDPFMGSGSTGVAAERLGFQFIGIERENDYFEIAKRRLSAS